jgi:hypothetical protein
MKNKSNKKEMKKRTKEKENRKQKKQNRKRRNKKEKKKLKNWKPAPNWAGPYRVQSVRCVVRTDLVGV